MFEEGHLKDQINVVVNVLVARVLELSVELCPRLDLT